MRKLIPFTLISLSLLLLCGVVLVTPLNAQTKREQKTAKDLAEAGNKEFNRRNFKGAIEKYEQSLKIVSSNPEAHFWKGNAHFNLKEYDQALVDLDLAESQGFKSAQLYSMRWYVNNEKKNYDAALKDLDSALAMDSNDATLLAGKGDVYFSRGSYDEALAAYQKAAAAAPKNAEVQFKMAKTYSKLENLTEQGRAAEAAIKNNTLHLGEAYFLLGEARQKQRDLPAAADAYRRSVAARPGEYAAYRNLADVYRGQGLFNDAIEILKKSFATFKPKGETYTELSWYYSLVGRDADAVEAAKAGVQLTPNTYAAHTNLCRAYNGVKNYAMALVSCNRALQLKANDGETYYYLGRAQEQLKKGADAARSYKKAVQGLTDYTRDNPDFTDGFYLLGNALFADNQFDKAVEANKRAVELSPGFAKARYNLAISYLAQKKKALAQEQYDELMKIDPDQAAKLKPVIDAN